MLFHGSGGSSFFSFPFHLNFLLLLAREGLSGNAKRCPQSDQRKLQDINYRYITTGESRKRRASMDLRALW
jgi:hypothetical protein